MIVYSIKNKFYKLLKISYKSCLFVDIFDKPHINAASHSTSFAISTDHSIDSKRHDRHNSTPKQLSTSSSSIGEIIHSEHGAKQPSDNAERKPYYCNISESTQPTKHIDIERNGRFTIGEQSNDAIGKTSSDPAS